MEKDSYLEEIETIASFFQNYRLPFPHSGGSWALAPESSQFLGSLIRYSGCENILEFGSGYSSLIIAYELEKANRGLIDSINSSRYWSNRAADLASRNNLIHRTRFFISNLGLRVCKNHPSIFYDMEELANRLAPKYDFVVIDAPHHDLGRDGALYLSIEKIKVGGYFFVDDCKAGHMQKTIKRWKTSFPQSISIKMFSKIGNGVAIIKKEKVVDNEPNASSKQYIMEWVRSFRNLFRLKIQRIGC